MKPLVVGSACYRVHQALEESLGEGALRLSPELLAHAARCPRCQPEFRCTETLLHRLRDAVTSFDLSKVPHAVDQVVAQTLAEVSSIVPISPVMPGSAPQRQASPGWVLGQVAAVAAIILLGISGVTYGLLKVNQAVSGVKPAELAGRLAAPLHDWTSAWFK